MESEKSPTNERDTRVGQYYRELIEAAKKCGAVVEILGIVEDLPIYSIKLTGSGEITKRKMITAGFHSGTEIAGQLSILEFLKDNPREYLDGVELTMLPLVNPTGYRDLSRENSLGEEVNRGYGLNDTNPLSREGKILMSYEDKILQESRDGEISLHGDEHTSKGGFVYCYEESQKLGTACLEILSKHFGVVDSDFLVASEKVGDPSHLVMPGLVVGDDDGDFGDRLHSRGIAQVLVTETPDKDVSLTERIAANVEIIKEFCRY